MKGLKITMGLCIASLSMLYIVIPLLHIEETKRIDALENRLDSMNKVCRSLEEWEANTDIDNEVHVVEFAVPEGERHNGKVGSGAIIDSEPENYNVWGYCCKKMRTELTRQHSNFYTVNGVVSLESGRWEPYEFAIPYCPFCGKKLKGD